MTTFRVGGPAEWYCEPHAEAELLLCLQWANSLGVPVTLLGAGSNLLISDAGLVGLVISTRWLRGVHLQADGRVWAAAGEPLINVVRLAAKQGWSGLEWAVGIPGTVGGAVVMNAGAHAQETATPLVEANLVDEHQNYRTLASADLGFSYRHSLLQERPWVVTGACFQLQTGHDPVEVSALTQRNWEQRQRSQPYDKPSCGSVFRNPPQHKAGWLIEQTGLKGFQIGGAQVAHRHANFILNANQASASDIHRLIHYVQDQVYRQWSLLLVPEVRILGDFDPLSPVIAAV
jgi:UDP-N-acetylmuramate dehydrogenase